MRSRIPPYQRRPGFLLVEVLLGIAIFGMFISAIGYTLVYGQEATIKSGNRIRGTYLSQRAIEAARAIRDDDFDRLTVGTHGIDVDDTNGTWMLSGSYVVGSGGFITSLTIEALDGDTVRVSADTKWKHGYNRSGSVLLVSDLSDWRAPRSVGNWSTITQEGSFTDAGTPTFVDLALHSGSTLFAASRSGNGLYVFDTQALSVSRINSSFSLGAGAYDVAVRGSMLFVATDNGSQEIRVYRVTSPSTFSSADLIGSYDLPGSGRARSLAVAGDTLYVGASASAVAGEDEFYALHVSGTGALSLLDTINDDSSTFAKIALSGTSAYLSSTLNTSELRVVNIQSGSNLLLLGGYNISGNTDALSVAVSGTSALVGITRTTTGEEVLLLDLETGGIPNPPPGPWYHEGSGSVVGIDIDPSHCFAFYAAESGHKALQIINIRDKSTLPEVETFDSTTGIGKAVLYDMARDRLFFATDQSVYLFRPDTSTGTCP